MITLWQLVFILNPVEPKLYDLSRPSCKRYYEYCLFLMKELRARLQTFNMMLCYLLKYLLLRTFLEEKK